MIQKKSDDAVSPVIGVMLIIVVTVVIAAVVTAFATGVVGETEPAPVAVLDVEIFSNKITLEGFEGDDSSGPELFITHLSGDPVDTADIELRFSWTHDGCSHYSTYSADGFTKSGEDVGREQPLYVKMTGGAGGGLNHYFGKVILKPGLTLTASSEFLDYGHQTSSKFMDAVFDNYHVSTESTTVDYIDTSLQQQYQEHHDKDTCDTCQVYINGVPMIGIPGIPDYDPTTTWDPLCTGYKNYYAYINDYCSACLPNMEHKVSECNTDKDANGNFICKCAKEGRDVILTGGIMEHLPPGTAVDVMIVHTPSNKAIYDKTVIVE